MDLFPTLVKLTGLGPPLQNCNQSLQKLEKLCTDGGKSIFDGEETGKENLSFLQYPRFGNKSCQVSKRGIQNQIYFWPKINHIQGNLFHFVNRHDIELSIR